MNKMQPTIEMIRQTLGALVFGENGIKLQQVVHKLLSLQKHKLAVIDTGLNGAVGERLSQAPNSTSLISTNETRKQMPESDEIESIIETSGASLGIAIGPINRNPDAVRDGQSFYEVLIFEKSKIQRTQFRYSGHSGWREERAIKEVLNHLRLYLASKSSE